MNTINFFGGSMSMNDRLSSQIRISGIPVSMEHITGPLYERLMVAERERIRILRAALEYEFPIQDLLLEHAVTNDQAAEMSAMVDTLSQKYALTHIICFAIKGVAHNDFSAFAYPATATGLHYFLLFVTKGTARVENEIQDYINTHYKSYKVTAIAHNFEAVRNAIAQGSRFFISSFVGGLEIYHDQLTVFDIKFPKLNQANTLNKAVRRFHHHLEMSKAFLFNAVNGIGNAEYYENGVFILHQAVEQACIAMIKVNMAYRADLHNLSRLLDLCKCFSEKPAEVFFGRDKETVRLFELLRKSYSDTRYSEDFKITREDALRILELVEAFVELADSLCREWIDAQRVKVGAEAINEN